jgi:uncharacterized protein HemY
LNSTQALAIDPSDGAAHRTLGKLYQDNGKDDEAIAQFEADIQTRPADQEAIYLAPALQKAGRYCECRKDCATQTVRKS